MFTLKKQHLWKIIVFPKLLNLRFLKKYDSFALEGKVW